MEGVFRKKHPLGESILDLAPSISRKFLMEEAFFQEIHLNRPEVGQEEFRETENHKSLNTNALGAPRPFSKSPGRPDSFGKTIFETFLF